MQLAETAGSPTQHFGTSSSLPRTEPLSPATRYVTCHRPHPIAQQHTTAQGAQPTSSPCCPWMPSWWSLMSTTSVTDITGDAPPPPPPPPMPLALPGPPPSTPSRALAPPEPATAPPATVAEVEEAEAESKDDVAGRLRTAGLGPASSSSESDRRYLEPRLRQGMTGCGGYGDSQDVLITLCSRALVEVERRGVSLRTAHIVRPCCCRAQARCSPTPSSLPQSPPCTPTPGTKVHAHVCSCSRPLPPPWPCPCPCAGPMPRMGSIML